MSPTEPKMWCVFCRFVDDWETQAEYIVDGLSVCYDHVDEADDPTRPLSAKVSTLLNRNK